MPAIAAALDIVPPAEWGASELGEEADLINGSAFRPEDWKTTGVPIVRIQNLKDRNAPFNYFQGIQIPRSR
jgi:type I restriction enzyme S subunit